MSATNIILLSFLGILLLGMLICFLGLYIDIMHSAYEDIKSKTAKKFFIFISVVPACVLPLISFYFDGEFLYALFIFFVCMAIGPICSMFFMK